MATKPVFALSVQAGVATQQQLEFGINRAIGDIWDAAVLAQLGAPEAEALIAEFHTISAAVAAQRLAAEAAAAQAAADTVAGLAPSLAAAQSASTDAEGARLAAEAARDQILARGGWNYWVETVAALDTISGMSADQVALVLEGGETYVFDGTAWQVAVNYGAMAQRYWLFTASGTWVKPGGLSPDQLLLVRGWGAGGGGATGGVYGGAGGGAHRQAILRIGDLPASVPVAIGAGGVPGGWGTFGGDTSFGGYLVAYGGAPGRNSNYGGAGAGSCEPGATPLGGYLGGGASGVSSGDQNGGNATTDDGGGGGSAGQTAVGGRAYNGGGGGGYTGGGTSVHGGNGGSYDPNIQPQAPGGGGARGQSGARGQLEVHLL